LFCTLFAWYVLQLRGKEVVVECKFDGDRIQVHKNGNDIHFFSRTFIDHSEFKEAIADTLCQNILPEKCILDGEMLVWDRLTNRFAEFGSNRGIAKEAKDGLDTGQQVMSCRHDFVLTCAGYVCSLLEHIVMTFTDQCIILVLACCLQLCCILTELLRAPLFYTVGWL
jgi:hypothetical protein